MTAPDAPDRTTWREVMAEILHRITDGPWGPGTHLPGEVDMAESFGCSRTTMNRALRALADEGYLDRRRKAGTRVRMAPLRAARFEIPKARDEVTATGAPYRYALLSRQVLAAPDWVRDRMALPPGAQAVHLLCLHFANDTPFQLEDRWINPTALPQVLDQGFDKTPPTEWLIAAVPYSQVDIRFSAHAADASTATHLRLAIGDPVFTVDRATWWQDQAITLVTLRYAPGYSMTTRY